MFYLKKGSSAVIPAGPAVMSSDGYSPSTGIAFTSKAIMISKAGGSFALRGSTQVASATSCYYLVPLSSNDTNTLGHMRVKMYKSSSHLPIWEDFTVVAGNVYDSLFGGSTYLQTDVRTIEGGDATTQITQAVLNTTLENAYTVKHGLRIMAAVLAGRSSGAGTTQLKFNSMGSSDVIRVTAQCGSSGNRKGMALATST
jgi:hypothetical protein